MTRYVDIFTRRQIVALTSFSDLVSLARDRVLADALAANVGKDDTPLHLGGRGSTAYADAVVTYLGLALGRLADLGSSIASWIADLGAIRNTFARQAIPMVWDFAECNPITDKWEGAVEWIVRCLAFMPTTRGGTIVNAVAQDNDYLIVPSLISTDPPRVRCSFGFLLYLA